MFSALGHGYYLFGFKHTLINISLSSKIYENTRLYFIYHFIYLFIFILFGGLRSAPCSLLILPSVCVISTHTFVRTQLCTHMRLYRRETARSGSQRHSGDAGIMDRGQES